MVFDSPPPILNEKLMKSRIWNAVGDMIDEARKCAGDERIEEMFGFNDEEWRGFDDKIRYLLFEDAILKDDILRPLFYGACENHPELKQAVADLDTMLDEYRATPKGFDIVTKLMSEVCVP